MQTKQKRALSEAQAKRCEEATHPRCRCRCGGAAHGAKRLGEDPERAAFEQLPEDDPHHLPEKRQGRRRRKDAPSVTWQNRALPGVEAPL